MNIYIPAPLGDSAAQPDTVLLEVSKKEIGLLADALEYLDDGDQVRRGEADDLHWALRQVE